MRVRPVVTTRVGARLAGALLAAATAFAGVGLVAPGASAAPRPSGTTPGGLISYISYADGAHQVFTMNPDGSDKRQRTFGASATKKCDPMLNPTNSNELVYAANDSGMYVHDLGPTPSVDDDRIENLAPASSTRGGGRRPTFSADGNTIVFHYSLDADADPAVAVYDLWMSYRQPGGPWSRAHQVTALTAGQSAIHARYSLAASSDWLAYSYRSAPTAAYELRVAKVPTPAPGTAPAPATATLGQTVPQAGAALLATWSRDGTRLAYVTSCAAAVEYVDVTYTGDVLTAGEPVPVAQSGGCGLSWSSSSSNHLVYADTGKIFVKDVTSTRRATSIGTGGMPSW